MDYEKEGIMNNKTQIKIFLAVSIVGFITLTLPSTVNINNIFLGMIGLILTLFGIVMVVRHVTIHAIKNNVI